MNLINKLTLAVCAAIAATGYAHAATIENPGFESKWDGWQESDPSAISSDRNSGKRSAKITGKSGYFSQDITVEPNTSYKLSAHVLGKGTIGAETNAGNFDSNIYAKEWAEVSVEFSTGSSSVATIFGAYGGSEGRFDDFTIIKLGETTGEGGGEEGNGNTCDVTQIDIVSAYDNGSNDGHYPEATIDGDFSDSSRWSSKGEGKTITYNLGAEVILDSIDLAWFKGSERNSYFNVEVSSDNSSWSTLLSNIESSLTNSLQSYDLDGATATYLRVIGNGNSSSTWNSLIETQVHGCIIGNPSEPVIEEPVIEEPVVEEPVVEEPVVEEPVVEEPVVIGELDPKANPSENFDLSAWYLSVPSDTDGSGTADSIKENQLNDGYQHSEYFYTATDGGMVFKCPIKGYKTSTSTSYTRTELREMLRRGDTSIGTSGVNDNNWVFGTAPDKSEAGGYDGVLKATLAVNHVTTSGSSDQIGRVIVGQIHANDDEPLRIYYRKLKDNSKGSIYFAHEPANGNAEQWYELIGSRSDSASNPSDGIALNEKFSYVVNVVGDAMTVTIKREGKADVSKTIDMSDSGYTDGGQYMYFKAGVYNQNKSGDDTDFVQATFYNLENGHTNWK